MRPDHVRPAVWQLDRFAGGRAEPLRDPLRASVPRCNERDHAGIAEPVTDGGSRLCGVALAPVLVCERPGQLRPRVRQVRTGPADWVVEVEADPSDPLARCRLDDELPGEVLRPAVQPVLHDTARIVLDAAEEVHDPRIQEKGRRILDVGGRRLAQDEALGPDHSRSRIERSNSITASSRWLSPRVRTVTMPKPGRDFDSRFSSTSVSARSVSPAKTGAGRRTSRQPRLTPRSDTSATDRPVTSASVNVESTSGRPHSVVAAYSASKWIGFVFSVSSGNETLSASSTVRPKRLRYTAPTSSSSYVRLTPEIMAGMQQLAIEQRRLLG